MIVMPHYTYIWEYLVHPEHVEAFEAAYHSEGTWVELFRRAEGYRHTELLRDRSNPLRFVTVDHWDSFDHWDAFRSDFADEFESIDARCEQYTQSEREIGRFESC